MPASRPEDMASVWEQAFNTGDVEQVMGLYGPDAVLIPQPGQVGLKLSIRLENKRVLTSGDLAMPSNT